MYSIGVYILVISLVTFIIRALPVTVIHRKIQNRFLRSFLYYVPYATLAVMTFPAIMNISGNRLGGLIAFEVGIVAAFFGQSLFNVAMICCGVVLLFMYLPI